MQDFVAEGKKEGAKKRKFEIDLLGHERLRKRSDYGIAWEYYAQYSGVIRKSLDGNVN